MDVRFGCCLNMVAREPDGTGVEHIQDLARAGYGYAELPLAELMQLSEAGFAQALERLDAAGIPCEACNNFFPGSMRLTGPAVDEEAVLAYAERALERASRLGARIVVFGSGGAKQVPPGFPLEKGYGQVVSLLQKIGPLAAQAGITIAIEPLRRAECNLINTFAEGCRLMRDVGHSSVGVLVDYYHLCEEKEPLSHLLDMGPQNLVHVHFAYGQGRTYPTLAQSAACKPFFEALKAIGYAGRISMEAYSKDFRADAAKALAFAKTMCEERVGV